MSQIAIRFTPQPAGETLVEVTNSWTGEVLASSLIFQWLIDAIGRGDNVTIAVDPPLVNRRSS